MNKKKKTRRLRVLPLDYGTSAQHRLAREIVKNEGGTLTVGGVKVINNVREPAELYAEMGQLDKPKLIVTPNVDHVICLTESVEFREAYESASLAIVDGMPIAFYARLIGIPGVSRSTGADLLIDTCKHAAGQKWRIAIMGGDEKSCLAAARRLSEKYAAEVCPVIMPKLTSIDDLRSLSSIAQLKAARPNIVFLCLGAPKQELWFTRWRQELPPAMYVGAGAAVDFASGAVRRAPLTWQATGMEWLWRLMQEPSRMWRRYLVRGPRILPIFMAAYLRHRGTVGSDPRSEPRTRSSVVVHVGPRPGTSGGMASVIEEILNLDLNPYTAVSVQTWGGRRKRLITAWDATKAAVWLTLRRQQWEIMHVHLSERGSFVREGGIALLGKFLKRPVVATLHGAQFEEFAVQYPFVTRQVLVRLDKVICLGSRHEQLVLEHASGARTTRMLNPVSTDWSDASTGYRDLSTAPQFLFVGEVGYRKGIDRLLSAWRTVRQQLPDATLSIAGNTVSGAEFPTVNSDGVSFLGEIPRTNLADELKKSRCLVLPSRAEVLPMAVLEALMVGTPVIYTKVGEWQNFESCDAVRLVDVDGVSESHIVDALAREMVSVGGNQESRSVRDAASAWARESVAADVIAERLRSVYDSVNQAQKQCWTNVHETNEMVNP